MDRIVLDELKTGKNLSILLFGDWWGSQNNNEHRFDSRADKEAVAEVWGFQIKVIEQ